MGAYLEWNESAPSIGDLNAWWWALFHSISAFNNAGFSLMPNNLVDFAYDPLINLSISFSIILGGLGYPVLVGFFVYAQRFFARGERQGGTDGYAQHLSGVASMVQVKIAVYGTLALLIIGTALTYWVEFSNHAYPVNSGNHNM